MRGSVAAARDSFAFFVVDGPRSGVAAEKVLVAMGVGLWNCDDGSAVFRDLEYRFTEQVWIKFTAHEVVNIGEGMMGCNSTIGVFAAGYGRYSS